MLGKADILGASDLKTISLTVPEWNGEIQLRELGGADLALFQRRIAEQKGSADTLSLSESIETYALLVALSVVKDGEKVFTIEDVPALENKPLRLLQTLGKACFELNGMSKAQVDEEEKK